MKEEQVIRMGVHGPEGCASKGAACFYLHGSPVSRIAIDPLVASASEANAKQFSSDGLAKVPD